MLVIAYRSRSPQIAAAARLLAISWAASLQIWMLLGPLDRNIAFAALDAALAWAFFRMSRGRWFPAPLFSMHAGLIVYNLYTTLIDSSIVWIATFLNRAFELALLYVIACAAYRIYILSGRIRR